MSLPESTILLALIVLTLAGCSTEQAAPAIELRGSAWQAEDIDQGGIIDNSVATIEFGSDGRVSGSTGCNRYFGSVTRADGHFSLSEVGSSRRACVPAIMNQEQRFLDALLEAERIEVQDDLWLQLFDAQGNRRLKFIRIEQSERTPADKPAELTAQFSCPGGHDFELRFLGPETVQISIGREDHILQRERTASGARYKGDGIDFWNHGAAATLKTIERTYDCERLGTPE